MTASAENSNDDAERIAALVRRARRCLCESTVSKKVERTRATRAWWFARGALDDDTDDRSSAFDDVVERPKREPMRVVAPGRSKPLGRGRTVESRVATLHALAHIESWAIDLSWDVISRFGLSRNMPREFYDDFVEVAYDEARHHEALANRLREYGSSYGALDVHDGLWESAMETANSLEARLVVEHCVHEARGLDVLPQTVQKFRANGDEASATLLESVIYPEEVTHCAAGLRWFKYLHARDGVRGEDESAVNENEETESSSVVRAFHALVRKHFAGALKPPFNHEARERAGFTPVWYEPLTVKT